MKSVTIFRKRAFLRGQLPLSTAFEQIQNGLYRTYVEEHRHLLFQRQKNRARYIRELIPEFTPAAQFHTWRDLGNLMRYNRIIHLEAAFGRKREQNNTKRTACQLPYTFACFEHVSGTGLVILVKTELGAVWHLHAFNAIRAYYQRELGLPIGWNGFSMSNLCTFSYDPGLYLNWEAPSYPVKITEEDRPLNYANLNKALAKRRIE